MTMKASEKKWIIILVSITMIAIIMLISMNYRNRDNKEEKKTETKESVTMLEDGRTINMSSKLQEIKTIEGIEITNIQLTQEGKGAMLIGTATNTTKQKCGGYVVDIEMVDEQENEIITLSAYIGELQPNQSMRFSTTANFDSNKVYNFNIKKK